jgi:inosine-uridine nucleoside N-ribohydrolase
MITLRLPTPRFIRSLQATAFALAVVVLASTPAFGADSARAGRIPVILDTDIGDDIDDTWALGVLLESPELDVKLVVGDHGKPVYRARLLAKFLERAGRTDIPVGLGMDTRFHGDGRQAAWVADYNLNSYPGRVYGDGVQALIDTIMQSPETVTVIAIGPTPNLAAALVREPRIAQKARFVGMHGSVRRGYGNSPTPHAEYNVKEDAKACQRALSAAWPVTITPLDTCGLVQLKGADYAKVRDARNPVAQAVLENYRVWLEAGQKAQADRESSVLFDTVAVYLALADSPVHDRGPGHPRDGRRVHHRGCGRQTDAGGHGVERPARFPFLAGGAAGEVKGGGAASHPPGPRTAARALRGMPRRHGGSGTGSCRRRPDQPRDVKSCWVIYCTWRAYLTPVFAGPGGR